MKCQLKYQWVKLPRNQMPPGKGIMGCWARLASRSAYRNGQARYCGYKNQVTIGSWVGGIVGFKSILGVKRREQALKTAEALSELNYISFELDPQSKKLTYQIKDWVVQCSGAPCMGSEAVYATSGYGFLCLPRNITQRLVEAQYQFDEADAWLDLWCHTVWQEPGNAFSHTAPAVQYGRYGAVLTLETLGRRWGWEKTKVWRFFRKHADAFPLFKLPGSFGCLIFNTAYPTGTPFALPEKAHFVRILDAIRTRGSCAHCGTGSQHALLGKWIAWFSRKIIDTAPPADLNCRVAHSGCNNTRAYFSPFRHCKSFFKDCQSVNGEPSTEFEHLPRDGPDTVSGSLFGGIEYGRFEGDPLW